MTPFRAAVRRRARRLGGAALVLFCGSVLGYQGVPELRIDSTQHSRMINRLDLDREGRWLVTASDDKSARLWRLPEGGLHRVFRPYSLPGNEGKLFAVAISPDASLIAAGGWTKGDHRGFGNHKVYLFDPANGELVTRIAGLDNTILHLDFSQGAGLADSQPGGALAGSLAGNNGIRVWNLDNQTEALRDMTYAGDSYWVEFSPDGESLVSTSQDGYIRLYRWRESRRQMQRHHSVKLEETEGLPFAARFSPDGEYIAVGYTDEIRIAVLSADDLSLAYWTAAAKGGGGDLFAPAWSAAGDRLYGGGGFQVDARFAVVGWGEGEQVASWPLARNTLMQLDALDDQRLLYAASTPSWGIVDGQGELVHQVPRPTLAFNAIFPDDLRLSADAMVVEFGYSNGEQQGVLRFSVAERLLAPPAQALADEVAETVPDPVDAPSVGLPPADPSAVDPAQPPAQGPETAGQPAEMAVREAQRILTDLGYAPGRIDDLLGTETRAAIERFQSDKGLAVTSGLDAETQAALRAAVAPATEEEAPREPPLTLLPPRTSAETLQLSNWKNSAEPRLNDQPLALTNNDMAMSYAFPHQRQGVLVGSRFRLHYFDDKGEEQWRIRTPGVAWAVNVAANDKVAVAAFSDGTLRWYRMQDGRELFALFPHADRKRWLAWMPDGVYAASMGGDGLAGWALNNKEMEAADFVPFANLQRKAYHPDQFTELLAAMDKAEEPVPRPSAEGLSAPPDTSPPAPPGVFPPRVLIDQPRTGDAFTTPEIEVKYRLRRHGGEPAQRLQILVDGRPWLERELESEPQGTGAITVKLPPRDLQLTLIALSEDGASPPESVRLQWRGEAAPPTPSTLYLLAVGMEDYAAHEGLRDLPECAASARALAERLPGHSPADKVETKLLINASGEEVVDGLQWLAQAQAQDLAMVLLCGHAARRAGPAIDAYQFFPVDTGTLSAAVFEEALTKPMGKVVVMLDTAHLPANGEALEGLRAADVEGFANGLAQSINGVNVFAAAVGTQVSEIAPESGLSVFTETLLDALKAPEEADEGEYLTLLELGELLSARVADATGGRQTPRLAHPPTFSDFPLVTPATRVVAQASASEGGAVEEVLEGEQQGEQQGEQATAAPGDGATTNNSDSGE